MAASWQRAVERRIKKDETIIIALSGGLDSRAILAAALRYTSKDKVITFTFGEKGSFDFEIGKMVAKKVGVKNIPLGVERKGFEGQYGISMEDIEGMVDVTLYFAINGVKNMKSCGLNVLSGYIGDFILGSYIYLDMINTHPITDRDYEEPANLIFLKDLIHSLSGIELLFSSSFCEKICNPISKSAVNGLVELT